MKYLKGQRVKGLHEHKNKTGTVIESDRGWVTLLWDKGKRKSTVEHFRVQLIVEDATNDQTN
jgi:hypothetical protein